MAVSATITGANSFTPAIQTAWKHRKFNVSVWGTFVATVTLQRSFDGGSTWLDVATYTTPTEAVRDEPELEALYRIGVKTGEFTSGTVNVRIGQGP